MSAAIRSILSVILVPVFALVLAGTPAGARAMADADGCEVLDTRIWTGDAQVCPDCGTGDDAPAILASAAIDLPATRAAAASAGLSLWTPYPAYPGHWPQAPPV